MSYTIILPISLRSNNDWILFSKLGIKSYEKYLDSTLKEFIIIASKEDIQRMEQTMKTSLPITYIDENILLSPQLKTKGWFKQQLLKLLAYSIVSTEYYLVLDADMYLTHSLSYTDLFDDDLIKYNSESWQTINNSHFSQNSRWWQASCKIMNFPIEQLQSTLLMSVTPEVLICAVVADLLAYIQCTYGNNWQQHLCDGEFTEFTLYWIYCLGHNHCSLYTTKGFPLWKHDHRYNVLDLQYAHVETVERSFLSPCSFFSVIQGYLPIDVMPYIEKALTFLNRKDIDCIFLCASMITPQRYQSFTPEERYLQTLQTAISAKKYIPNSLIILLEGSVLTEQHKRGLNEYFDIVLEYGKDTDVLSYVHHPSNIGHGECRLLEKGVNYLQSNLLQTYNPSNIIKLGARYILTDQFDFNQYSKTQFTFRPHYDESVGSNVYTTGVFSIPPKELEFFRQLLLHSHSVLPCVTMVEKMYYDMIPSNKIHHIDTLGLKGELSYNRTLFEK